MSKFNAAVNTIGIADVKVRQALMKLLENSVYNREQSNRDKDSLEEQIRRLSQKLSTIDFDIDEETAQKIADKISAAIGESVSVATAAAQTATAKAKTATDKAAEASADASELRGELQNIQGVIEQKAQQAASALIQQTQEAVNGATQAAQQASQSAQNAATTAGQASQAATNAQNAVNALTFRNLTGTTVYNANADQYRKVATLPAVSGAANAVITFFGSIGGFTNATQKPIYVSIGQRQNGTAYEAISAKGFAFGSSLPAYADIVIYKESNNTFSVYLKGAKASYFRHNLSMTYAELVTPVSDTFKTSTPTGTLVWSLLANYKVLANADDVTNAITTLKTSANTWSAAQTFSALLTANGKILAKPTAGSWYQGRDLAAFKTNVATTGYVPIFSVKSSTGSWEIGTYTANNELHFAHITDENYNAKNNVATVNIRIGQDGRINGVVDPVDASNDSSVPTTAWVRKYAAATFQAKGSYAAADHNHDSVYQAKGSYAAADHNHSGVYAAANHSHSNYSNETYSFAVYNTDFGTGNTAIAMAGLVKDTSATYNVRVLFYNTAATKRTVVANGTSLTLAATVGATISHQFTIAGNGKFTIDNIATSVDVFITIWR